MFMFVFNIYIYIYIYKRWVGKKNKFSNLKKKKKYKQAPNR